MPDVADFESTTQDENVPNGEYENVARGILGNAPTPPDITAALLFKRDRELDARFSSNAPQVPIGTVYQTGGRR